MTTLHIRVVKRACDMAGGYESLAERLRVSRPMVKAWLTGKVRPSPRLFFEMVDIIQGDSLLPSASFREAGHAESQSLT